jgi:hypothetical protein
MMTTSKDPIIISLEISRKGVVTLKFVGANGESISIQGDKLAEFETPLPLNLDKNQLELFKNIAFCSLGGSDLKVYINLGDRVLCFLIDSDTGQLKGRC